MSTPLSQITFEFSTEENTSNENVIMETKAKLETTGHEDQKSNGLSKRGRRPLKEVGGISGQIDVPEDEILFKKQYYPIGEVAAMFHENQSLIRYWETEFDILQPRKNRKGDRFFRPVDIKNLVLIYDLLRRRKFTIEGAREFLKKGKKAEEKFAVIQSLEKIKGFLLELKATL
jgi:DNA-binding transcriptional MerR regulator